MPTIEILAGAVTAGITLQEDEAEERDKGSGKEKKRSGGEEDGKSGYERGQRAVDDVVCSKPVVPKREEEGGPVEVEEEEKKSEDSRPIEEKTAAAALCKKGDGKGWHCKRAAQCGYSLCQYHLDKLRSYYSYSQTKKKKKKTMKPKSAALPEKSTAAGVAHRQGASQRKQKKSSSRPVEEQHVALSTGPGVSDSFYYYSGFGPRWGKRKRCWSGDAGAKTHDGGAPQAAQPSPHTPPAAAPAAGEEEGEEEEGEFECDSRGRDGRPWKSRALSSLL
ncbi:hypothetical protein Taro_009868 [Colocasia esculenta]|uniref:WRC domain-containing protein n=1 Tax=Colocasia esculenta TaxID=4460 RepID=A0A843U654_COLES|nr:hypothetical protein [Colocasia esculenta]